MHTELLQQHLKVTRFIDAHCHQTDNLQVLRLENIELSAMTQLDQLPLWYSVGIHPWAITNDWQAKLEALQAHPGLLAIGECGLDKAIQRPLSQQQAVFEAQIELARQWRKPLIIHCVRAFNELKAIKRQLATDKPWLIHGFRGSQTQLLALLDAGFDCSFGAALLNANTGPSQYLAQLPRERWLLETDADSTIGIDAIYHCAARMLGWDVDALHRQMQINFQRIFIDD